MTPVAALIPVLAFEEIDSTNAEARRRAAAGERGPLWVAAERQTAGRGRRGRAWETGGGNLAATLLLTLERSPSEAALMAFIAALAVAEAVQSVTPDGAVRLKWPNDVMLAGRKVAGILIESGRSAEGRLWLAVGVGINLKTPPEAAERPATAVALHLRPGFQSSPTPTEALARLGEGLSHWIGVWEQYGSEPVLAAWSALAEGMGEPCTVRLEGETLMGVAEGLESDGALRLRLPDATIRRITAGDVFFHNDAASGAP